MRWRLTGEWKHGELSDANPLPKTSPYIYGIRLRYFPVAVRAVRALRPVNITFARLSRVPWENRWRIMKSSLPLHQIR